VGGGELLRFLWGRGLRCVWRGRWGGVMVLGRAARPGGLGVACCLYAVWVFCWLVGLRDGCLPYFV